MNRILKRTPIYSIAKELHAQFGERDGWAVAESYAELGAELAAARERIALADETPNGKILIEGVEAESVARAASDTGTVYRLRGDLFFVSTSPGTRMAALGKLAAALADRFVTITDVTDGRAELRAIGPASCELMSKLCGLDFHTSIFLNGTAKQSSLAKTPQLIIRRDTGGLTAFSVIGAYSFGAYLCDTILKAGHECGIVPIGQATLRKLES